MLYSRPCCLSRAHTLDFISTLSFWITFSGFSYLTKCSFLKTFELLTPALDLQAFSLAPLILFMFSDSPYLKNIKCLFSGPCHPLELPSDSHVLYTIYVLTSATDTMSPVAQFCAKKMHTPRTLILKITVIHINELWTQLIYLPILNKI